MAETILTLFIMGLLGFIAAFGGYIIIAGDREEAEQKRAKRRAKAASQ